jgi:hypothetical protein
MLYHGLHQWIDIYKLKLRLLSLNINGIDLLKKYPNKIDWFNLSRNPGAIDFLKEKS